MLTLFWDERGVILEHYMPRGNSVTYADLLKNHLLPAIKSKWRGLVSTGVLLQHDNTRPNLPVQLLQQSKICPSSFFHIRPTRQTSSPVTFMSLDHSKRRWEASLSGPTKAGGAWVAALSAKRLFFSKGIHALPKRWNTCMVRNGDYLEKWSHCVPFVFNKLRDKKYLKFSFDSPTYLLIYSFHGPESFLRN